MNKFFKLYLNYMTSLHRYLKRIIIILTDAILCVISTWLAFVLRLEEFILYNDFNLYPAVISIIIAIPLFWLFGLYRTIYRYTGISMISTILAATFLYGLIFFLIIGVYGIQSVPNYIGQAVPRSIGVLQPMLLFFSIIGIRLSVKYILIKNLNIRDKLDNKKNVIIYGAGDAGRQLVVALENNSEFEVVGFLDDNDQLHRQIILGKVIYSPSKLKKLIKKKY